MQWHRKKLEARRPKTSDWAVQTLREQVVVVAMGRRRRREMGEGLWKPTPGPAVWRVNGRDPVALSGPWSCTAWSLQGRAKWPWVNCLDFSACLSIFISKMVIMAVPIRKDFIKVKWDNPVPVTVHFNYHSMWNFCFVSVLCFLSNKQFGLFRKDTFQ